MRSPSRQNNVFSLIRKRSSTFCRRYFKQQPFIVHLVVYILLVACVALILFWRFPNNVTRPNFYGEDGSVYLQNILNKGWPRAIVTPFNGYYIIGLYGLEAFGFLLNFLFAHSSFLTLPQYFAMTAIIFMAAVIALPYLLLRETFGKKVVLMTVLFSSLLPLPVSPHIVIGTIGNQKWIFLYLATLLTLYRLFNYKKLSTVKVIFADIFILISAFTNTTTYFLIPLLYLPYLLSVWHQRNKSSILKSFLRTLKTRECTSLILMSALLMIQVAYIGLHGIPKLPGYLDTPYQANKTIELFINRTFLFGVTHGINGRLNDFLSLLLFAFLVIVGSFALKKTQRVAFIVSLYSALMASILFTVNRPGVTSFFFGYKASGSGPDQFFYAQTLVMYLPIILAAFAFTRLLIWPRVGALLLLLFIAFVVGTGIRSNALYGSRWRNASVFENYTNTFVDQAITSCHEQGDKTIKIVVYPYPDGRFSLFAQRQDVCTQQLSKEQLSYQSYNLDPFNNNYLTINHRGDFYQSFIAGENNLNGIRIFLSDFANYSRKGTYMLVLYDRSCENELASAAIPNVLLDNTYYDARFAPIHHSKNSTYCFSLTPPGISGFNPLAVQESKPDVYPQGLLLTNNTVQASDIVFQTLYTQTK